MSPVVSAAAAPYAEISTAMPMADVVIRARTVGITRCAIGSDAYEGRLWHRGRRNKMKKCDTCDAPAMSLARDVLRHEVPGQTFIEYSPVGKDKAGRNQHPVSSVEHVTQLPRRT